MQKMLDTYPNVFKIKLKELIILNLDSDFKCDKRNISYF